MAANRPLQMRGKQQQTSTLDRASLALGQRGQADAGGAPAPQLAAAGAALQAGLLAQGKAAPPVAHPAKPA